MADTLRILGLINARGGSKGVLGKNKKMLLGKPLIAYSVEAGLKSTYLDKIVVSTDDEEIAAIACDYGAEVPFIRPAELASDTAKQMDTIIHAIQFFEDQGEFFDVICLLQPTCPMRSVDDIDGTLQLMQAQDADSAISITDVGGRHPLTLYTKADHNIISPYLPADSAGVQRQDFEDLYWRTGAVYAMKRDVVMKDRSLYGARCCGYVVPEERAFNIDSPFDWDLCEAYMQAKFT